MVALDGHSLVEARDQVASLVDRSIAGSPDLRADVVLLGDRITVVVIPPLALNWNPAIPAVTVRPRLRDDGLESEVELRSLGRPVIWAIFFVVVTGLGLFVFRPTSLAALLALVVTVACVALALPAANALQAIYEGLGDS